MGICYFFLCLFSFLVNFSPVLYYLNPWNRLEKIKRWWLMGAKFYTTCKAHANTKNYTLLKGNQKL